MLCMHNNQLYLDKTCIVTYMYIERKHRHSVLSVMIYKLSNVNFIIINEIIIQTILS